MPLDPVTATQAVAGGMQLVGNLIGRKAQERSNKRMLKYQAALNEKYLQKQLDYNSPAAQMARYKEAGLNPHLIYGQGTPGNQAAPLQSPSLESPDYQNIASDVIDRTMQAGLQAHQVQAIDANTAKAQAQTAVATFQARVLEANPNLNPIGYNAMIDSLKATAETKRAEAIVAKDKALWWKHLGDVPGGGVYRNGWRQMDTELKLLDQKFNLSKSDLKVKAEIIQSKEFQNALQEIQLKWMQNAEITPQHIYQFITMLLMKMM